MTVQNRILRSNYLAGSNSPLAASSKSIQVVVTDGITTTEPIIFNASKFGFINAIEVSHPCSIEIYDKADQLTANPVVSHTFVDPTLTISAPALPLALYSCAGGSTSLYLNCVTPAEHPPSTNIVVILTLITFVDKVQVDDRAVKYVSIIPLCGLIELPTTGKPYPIFTAQNAKATYNIVELNARCSTGFGAITLSTANTAHTLTIDPLNQSHQTSVWNNPTQDFTLIPGDSLILTPYNLNTTTDIEFTILLEYEN